jgi:hypothetical protein
VTWRAAPMKVMCMSISLATSVSAVSVSKRQRQVPQDCRHARVALVGIPQAPGMLAA